MAKSHEGRRRRNLRRSVTSRNLKLQAGDLPGEDQWSDAGTVISGISDFSDHFSEFSDYVSESELFREAKIALDKDISTLRNAEREINLLKWNPKDTNLRRVSKLRQWRKKDKLPSGDYLLEPRRETISLAIYHWGLLKWFQDILDTFQFSSMTISLELKNFFRKFLKNFPRKYFFTSPDLRSVRAKYFWALRQASSLTK